MKKIIIFLAILIATILLTSCTTQQRVVYRDCDCPTNRYDYWNRYSWGNNPYWSWNDWGWNYLSWYPYRVIPRYYVYPNQVQPQQPSRYERRQTTGPRPSRNSYQNDNLYPRRTPGIPSIDAQPSRIESTLNRYSQPQQRTTQPSRVESTPNRYSQPQQRTTQPSRVESNPSRYNQPQQRTTQPSTNQNTPSRVQTRGGENIKE
jgi:hypothetical protein